ncbi:MAG: type II toxin-antitoxin system VapC family toxin [Nitrospirae bacterium]|nr:type II toxin-antitoxin system VapC family toxin [Nitrospirota bacterium]
MKTLVLDSHALLAYFEKDAGWEAVSQLLQEASEERCHLVLSAINWGEVYYITLREYGEEYARKVAQTLSHMPVEIVDATQELALHAARLKARGGLSYADCFAAGLAKMKKHSVLVTGDKEFKRVADEITIHWV